MDEKALLDLWNDKRQQIILAQVAPALVLIAVLVLAAQGTFSTASDASRYLAIAVAASTGLLAVVSQFAVIREAQALVADLEKLSDGSALSRKVAASRSFLSLTAVGVVGLSLIVFALVVWSVLG
jgi:lysylphosphatidylglycerol synthetase-like protein (DUF2156 family)